MRQSKAEPRIQQANATLAYWPDSQSTKQRTPPNSFAAIAAHPTAYSALVLGETKMANETEKLRVVNERFQVKSGDTIVTLGINPEKGGLSVYGWTDQNGYHSLGRFPTTKYSSQWKAMAAVIPAIMQFIAYDEKQPTPKLAVKTAKGVGMGETLEFNAVETLDELLNADGDAI